MILIHVGLLLRVSSLTKRFIFFSNMFFITIDDGSHEFKSYHTEAAGGSNQVDLFGGSLIGDLMDAPTPVPSENTAMNKSPSDVDLFADATFVSAPPQVETRASPQSEVR